MKMRHLLLLMGCVVVLILSLALVLNLSQEAEGREIVVDETGEGDFTDLSLALNASEAGDLILVREGNYSLDLDLLKDHLSINGAGMNHSQLTLAEQDEDPFTLLASVNITGVCVSPGDSVDEPGLWFPPRAGYLSIVDCGFVNFSKGLTAWYPWETLIFENNTLVDSPMELTLSRWYDPKELTLPGRVYISNNSLDGRPLGIVAHQENFSLEDYTTTIQLINCSNVTIRNPTLNGTSADLMLYYCQNISVTGAVLNRTPMEIRGGRDILVEESVFTTNSRDKRLLQVLGSSGVLIQDNSFTLNFNWEHRSLTLLSVASCNDIHINQNAFHGGGLSVSNYHRAWITDNVHTGNSSISLGSKIAVDDGSPPALVITGNKLGRLGLELTLSELTAYSGSNVTNYLIEGNTLDNKPIYVYLHQQDVVVPGNAGQVLALNSQNLTVQDQEFSNFRIIEFWNLSTLSIRNCSFQGSASEFRMMYCEELLMDNCSFSFCNLKIFHIEKGLLRNCTLDTPIPGVIHSRLDIQRSTNVTVENGSYQVGPVSTAIYLYATEGCVITGCQILDSDVGISLRNSHNTTISRNHIFGNDDNGIDMSYCHNTSITGNEITGNKDGINLWSCHNTSITRNNFSANRIGIFAGVELPDHSIIYNNFQGNLWCGFYSHRQDNYSVEKNWWGDASGPGEWRGEGGGNGDNATAENLILGPWLIEPANAGPNATDDGPEPANSDSLKREKDDEPLLSPGVLMLLVFVILLLTLLVVAVKLPSPSPSQEQKAAAKGQKEKQEPSTEKQEDKPKSSPATTNICPHCNSKFEIGNPSRPLKLNCPFCKEEVLLE